jgi:hypothetical protein
MSKIGRDVLKMKKDKLIFEDKKIRSVLHKGELYFSVVDVVLALTNSSIPKRYWSDLKRKLLEEGFELYEKIVQLRLEASDGKKYLTDCANKKGIFRIIQSIPSKKAEPFKMWLAKLGSDRIDEIENPELAQERIKDIYEKKGYSKSWIDKRLRGIAVRQDLTDEWKLRGVEKQSDFAILTAEISKASFGMTPHKYKKFKGLEKENLRDHMTDLELIFSMLGEASTAEIERTQNPEKFEEHKIASIEGGKVAKNAREDLERKTGKDVISEENFLDENEESVKKQNKKLVVKK